MGVKFMVKKRYVTLEWPPSSFTNDGFAHTKKILRLTQEFVGWAHASGAG